MTCPSGLAGPHYFAAKVDKQILSAIEGAMNPLGYALPIVEQKRECNAGIDPVLKKGEYLIRGPANLKKKFGKLGKDYSGSWSEFAVCGMTRKGLGDFTANFAENWLNDPALVDSRIWGNHNDRFEGEYNRDAVGAEAVPFCAVTCEGPDTSSTETSESRCCTLPIRH